MIPPLVIRTAIKSIGKEKIREGVNEFILDMIRKKDTLPLMEGESDMIAILYESEGKAMYSFAATCENESGNLEIKRYLEPVLLEDMVLNLIEQL